MSGTRELETALGSGTGLNVEIMPEDLFTDPTVRVQIGDNRSIYMNLARDAIGIPKGFHLSLCLIQDNLPDELSKEQREKIYNYFSTKYPDTTVASGEIGHPIDIEDEKYDESKRCLWVDVTFQGDISVAVANIPSFVIAAKEFSL